MSQQPEQNPADGGTPQDGQGQPQQGYPQYQTGQGAPQYGAPAYAGQPQAAGSVDQLLQQKPQQVRTGLLILWISLALTVVLGIIAALTLDFEATYTQQAQVNGQTVDATTVSTMASAARITALVAYILMGAVGALFVWFAGKGRNWALIVLLVFAALSALGVLASLATGGLLGSIGTIVFIIGVILLFLKPSSAWYRAVTAARQAPTAY
ncbi:hypothetical protein LBW78_05430 [Rothia kristinae]|uniref:hypothetical protein n=1 Tax=Rothia kristinae TaxID=37923 RepID=UPI001CD5A9F4|nr:hypothetical protein [Rothia kristinae]MCA1169832.1 hypothetical protein [Rothia kristinae]